MSFDPRSVGSTIFVRFLPSWEFIDSLRQLVEVAVRSAGRELADRAMIVTQELLENAVKYGTPTSAIELDVRASDPSRQIEICVSNRAQPARLTLLERELTRVGSTAAQDAFARALQRLQRLPQGTTMLGVARIAMESELTAKIEGDRVQIVATITPRSAPTPSQRPR